MIMMNYPVLMGAAVLLTMLLYVLRVKKAGMCLLTLLLSLVLGFAGAKLLYTLTIWPVSLENLTSMNPERFSIVGGALGVVLAAVIAAKCCKIAPMKALDSFAPCGALLLAAFRAGEYFLGPKLLGHGMIGLGSDVPDGVWYCRFPFAMVDNYDMWYYAVFMLECLLALIAALLAVTVYRRRDTFLRTASFVMAAQLFTEMLHSQSMKWGFVCIEQLLCVVILFLIVLSLCLKSRRFGPCVWMIVPVGVYIWAEFEIDKCWLNSWLWELETAWSEALADYTTLFCYVMMALMSLFILLLVGRAARNRQR